MRHVHSDIPAVEFARPLNAETQNTFAVLASRVSNMYISTAYIPAKWSFDGIFSAGPPQHCVFNCDCRIAESTICGLCQLRFQLCRINTASQVCKARYSWERLQEVCLSFSWKCHHVMRENEFCCSPVSISLLTWSQRKITLLFWHDNRHSQFFLRAYIKDLIIVFVLQFIIRGRFIILVLHFSASVDSAIYNYLIRKNLSLCKYHLNKHLAHVETAM